MKAWQIHVSSCQTLAQHGCVHRLHFPHASTVDTPAEAVTFVKAHRYTDTYDIHTETQAE